MTNKKQSGRGGVRQGSGRKPNIEKGLPSRKRKQFSLYPADIADLEAMAGNNGSALVRGLIRYAATLPTAEIQRLIEAGKLIR